MSFPDSLSPEVARKLSAAFAKQPELARKGKSRDEEKEEVEVEEVKMEDFDGQGEWKGGQEEQEDLEGEEEEEDHGPFGGRRRVPRGAPGGGGVPGPQCAQQ